MSSSVSFEMENLSSNKVITQVRPKQPNTENYNNNITAATISALMENKHQLKRTGTELAHKEKVLKENWELKNTIVMSKSNKEDIAMLEGQVRELKKQPKIKEELCKSVAEKQRLYVQQEAQLKQVTKERDFLSKQLLYYKNEFGVLKKKYRDLEMALSRQEKERDEKNHVLELKVEKLLKEKSNLESNLLTAKHITEKRVQRDKALLKEKRRYSDLEEQLERAIKELNNKPPPQIIVNLPSDAVKVYEKNVELKAQLTTKRRQLERKDQIIDEKEKECEQLKHSMSRLLPPESLELIPKCQWVIREQRKKIESLMGQANMWQIKAKEYKSENEKLVDQVAAIRKLYLDERMQNTDLREVLKKTGTKQVPEDKPGAIQVPLSVSMLHKQSGEKQVHTKMQTLRSSLIRLPPISNKLQSLPNIKSDHTREPTVTKKIMFKAEENSDLPPTTKTFHYQSRRKSSCTPLPPISRKSLKVQSAARQPNIFMTETGGDQH